MDYFNYKRRKSSETKIGSTPLGGDNPIRIQSMTNTDTNDTAASVEQTVRIIEAGGDYVRLTAQGIREAENLKNIEEGVRAKGYNTPLIADIHFNPNAAEIAAHYVEKVRINPGNFVDKQKRFESLDFTDEEFDAGIDKMRERLLPLLDICKKNNTAIRIGVNHGSLSGRIMSRYGDTPQGMVESCMEALHICLNEDFKDIVISIKASNTVVMTKTVRLLIDRMNKEGLAFPLHLGVTEAGDGEDGRIKSAVGIGSLLADGIGDTIRVSLSEEPELEIPVAKKLTDYITARENHPQITAKPNNDFSPFSTNRYKTHQVKNIGGDNVPVVISDRSNGDYNFNPHFLPDFIYVGKNISESTPRSIPLIIDANKWLGDKNTFPLFEAKNYLTIKNCKADIKFFKLQYSELNDAIFSILNSDKNIVVIICSEHKNPVGEERAFIHTLLNNECDCPVILSFKYNEEQEEDLQLKAAADFGAILLDGFGAGIMLQNIPDSIPSQQLDSYSFGILQAARVRTSKTEYISCPSCGRTLFDLQTTIAKVKEATSHLKHLKIGIMGCIVNGPGEMADADYGYVGAAKGKITLYKKQEAIEKNIPSEQAVERLVELIKKHGDWIEPEN